VNPEMIRKIDSVLDRVKDPESNLPVSRLGVVRRIRYSEEHKKLYVFADFYHHLSKCVTCSAIGLAIASKLVQELGEEFQAEFPELSVEFV
jgi:metal-sulfur cluster biosynthetic enzyme